MQRREARFVGTGLRTDREGIIFDPDLIVSGWNGQWTIRGASWFKPNPVLEAWRQATNWTVNTG